MFVPGSQKRESCGSCCWLVGWCWRWLWGGGLFQFAPKTSEFLTSHKGRKHSSSLLLSYPSALPQGRRILWFFAQLGSHESVLPPCLKGGCWQPYLSALAPKDGYPSKTQVTPATSQGYSLRHCKVQLLPVFLPSSQDRQVGLSRLSGESRSRLEQSAKGMLGSALNRV